MPRLMWNHAHDERGHGDPDAPCRVGVQPLRIDPNLENRIYCAAAHGTSRSVRVEAGSRSSFTRTNRAAGSGAIALAAGAIVLATAAAFSSSFRGAWIYDDMPAIVENPTIRQLWPVWKPLCPPLGGKAVSGRPLLNLSLAINYAISGNEVWSYHAANLVIHVLAALTLFGILRRTLLLPTVRDRLGSAAVAVPLAAVIALLWALHPLQTESVTYITQRAESLMGLFYLLTLYCFIRGSRGHPIFASAKIGTVPTIRGECRGSGVRGQGTGRDSRPSSSILPPVAWYAASVTACLLGMATKEVMISAPLIVLLYDRTFCAGSFRQAWRRRPGFYAALACTWLLLGWLVLSMMHLLGENGPGTASLPGGRTC